jgi:hypothetical protein
MTKGNRPEHPAVKAANEAREPYHQARELIYQSTTALSRAIGFLRYHAINEGSEVAAEIYPEMEDARTLLTTLADHLSFRGNEVAIHAIDDWWREQDRQAER